MSQYKVLAQKLADGSAVPVGPNGPVILQKKLVRDPSWPDDMAPVLVRSKYVPGGPSLNNFMYLSQDGSDANDGRSVEYPLKTLKKAAEVSRGIKGHVILYVMPGTYDINMYTTPSINSGIDYRCRLYGKFLELETIRAYDPTSKPIFVGSGFACYGACSLTGIEFRCPVRLCTAVQYGMESCNIVQASDAQSSRIFTLDSRASCNMGYCNFEVSKPLDNLIPIEIVTGSYFIGYANNNMERTPTAATKYLLGVGSNAGVHQYDGKINFSDASGKPLAVYNSASFFNNGNAAPTSSFIAEKALVW